MTRHIAAGEAIVDQFIYLFVIVAAMFFGWFIYQRNHNNGDAGSTQVPSARKRKQRPRKKR